MNAVELHRLARVLREMAVAATANPGEQPVAASTLAIVEDVAAHPGTSISQIVERTGLAQSLVSGTTARLTRAGALVQEQDPNDRRRTLVSMNEKMRAEDFAERGARGIGDAIRRAIPCANDTQIAEIESGLDHLAQQLFHSAGTQAHRNTGAPGHQCTGVELAARTAADSAARPVAEPWVLAVIATPPDWVLSVPEYSIFIRPDLLQQFWQVMSGGGFITDAVEVIDTSRRTGRRVLVEAGGVRPRRGRGLKGRCLTFAERAEIALARAAGESMRSIGKQNQTAIGTLVERQTGYGMLLHLPDGYQPEQVRDALAAKIKTLPESLRLSLSWDQGPEMRDWKHVSVDAEIDIYFCDPHSPWQRGTNENFNGLLRQSFPKGTDLGVHSSDDLDWVAQELNDRPRKRLAFNKPIELIGDLLLR